jgi:hypothetical protein
MRAASHTACAQSHIPASKHVAKLNAVNVSVILIPLLAHIRPPAGACRQARPAGVRVFCDLLLTRACYSEYLWVLMSISPILAFGGIACP